MLQYINILYFNVELIDKININCDNKTEMKTFTFRQYVSEDDEPFQSMFSKDTTIKNVFNFLNNSLLENKNNSFQ